MPSASTKRPMSASTPIVSSLCSRTRPTSLTPTDLIFPRSDTLRSPGFEVYGAAAQRSRKFGAGLKTIVRHFRQCSANDGFYALRQLRAQHANRGMRFARDFVHEPGHGVGTER